MGITGEQLVKLKELAEQATPGPWREIAHTTSANESTTYLGNSVEAENKDTYPGYTYNGMIQRHVCQINADLNCRSEFWEEKIWEEKLKNMRQSNRNRNYIMAVTPDVILAMIAEIERLRAIAGEDE